MTDTTKRDDGGPAFPFAATDPSNVPMQAPGMTLRDWFAGQALAPLLADFDSRHGIPPGDFMRHCAVTAYRVADAMIAARNSHE